VLLVLLQAVQFLNRQQLHPCASQAKRQQRQQGHNKDNHNRSQRLHHLSHRWSRQSSSNSGANNRQPVSEGLLRQQRLGRKEWVIHSRRQHPRKLLLLPMVIHQQVAVKQA
jgi:hypothetical protein